MPYADEMLRYISKRGIRSGVVSNIGWSGKALKSRIERLLPENWANTLSCPVIRVDGTWDYHNTAWEIYRRM
jgi:hypothetical protein